MSHVSVINAEIKNLTALKKACKRLGLIYHENQKEYKWYGHHVGDYPVPEGLTINDMGKCLHAIEVPGAKYEVGIIKDPFNKSNYKLVWDFYSSGQLEKIIGKEACKLVQSYEVEQTLYTAKLNNKMVTEKRMDDRIRLTVTM